MRYLLDFRERNVGGAVTNGVLRPGILRGAPGGLDELRRETRVTFLLHGYNVDRKDGRESLNRLARKLPSQDGAGVVLVVWPGDHRVGFLSYSFEGRDADACGLALCRYVAEIASLQRSVPLQFVTHSLGARVALEAARRLQRRRYRVGQMCLMAAAIDDSSLANPGVYRKAAASADRVAVLSSKRDKTLRFAYPAGDLFQSFLFARDIADRALGYNGPKSYRDDGVPSEVIAEAIADGRGSDHGHYIPGKRNDGSKRYKNQLSAASFADQVLRGDLSPTYE